ncbi:MAG: 7TM diverse intracellular signaling domain-containing protein, partial [Ferruginibacter sp.]
MSKAIKFLFITATFLCGIGTAFSQQSFVINDSDHVHYYEKNVLHFIDTTDRLSFNEITGLPNSRFVIEANSLMSFGQVKNSWWFKISIENRTSQDVYLMLKNLQIRILDCYVVHHSGKIDSSKVGLYRKLSGHFFQTNFTTFNLGSDPEIVYLRIQTPTLNLPIVVGTIQPIVKEMHNIDLLDALLAGIMFALGIYNLVLFFYLKDRLHLYYFGYVICSAYLALRSRGYVQEYITPGTVTHYIDNNFISTVIMGFVWLFTIKFLNTKALSPAFHKWITFLLLLAIVMLPTEFFTYQPWFNNFYALLFGIYILSLIVGSIHIYLIGYKPALYYLWAFGAYYIGSVTVLLGFAGVFSFQNFWVYNCYHIGAALEALILSFAIAHRMNTYKIEAQVAKNLLLERTSENEKLLIEHTQLLQEKLSNPQKKDTTQPDLQALFKLIRESKNRVKKLSIPTLEGVILLPIEDILRVEAMGSYGTIYLSNNKKIVASKPIAFFEKQLENEDFFRVHKS